MRFVSQILAVCLSFFLIYVWQISVLSSYTLYVIGTCLFLYFGLIVVRRIPNVILNSTASIQLLIVNTILFLLVFATGSLSSPLFFLLYFIAFGIAFVLNPIAILCFSAGLILVFLPDVLVGDTVGNFIRVGSVALLSPIAYLLVREFKDKNENRTPTDQNITKDIVDRAEEESRNANELEKIKGL